MITETCHAPRDTFTVRIPVHDDEGTPLCPGDLVLLVVVKPRYVDAWPPGWNVIDHPQLASAWHVLASGEAGSSVTLTGHAPDGWQVHVAAGRPVGP